MFESNEAHQELVKQGAKAVDEWRRTHPGETLNLLGAMFFQSDLSGYTLSGANLRFSNKAGRR
jgi:uncharacterized protein YjbI with pentapeptide repeats